MMTSIRSAAYSLQQLVRASYCFNVPRYQRLYVWGDEQVRTLLEDLRTAFERNRKADYYVGGILLVKSQAPGRWYDLIDGQQRLTTLWLLSRELGGTAAVCAS